MNKRETGTKYETLAAEYLLQNGYHILHKNFRCKQGEVDIIARDGKYLVFIEVKYRSTLRSGHAVSAVSYKKQQTISRVAAFYLLKYKLSDSTPCRFDVVAIDGERIQLYKNAFEYHI